MIAIATLMGSRSPSTDRWRPFQVLEAIEAHCRVTNGGGYSGLANTNIAPPRQADTLESFFFAETLKYLFLLFADEATLSLESHVLTTEAHVRTCTCTCHVLTTEAHVRTRCHSAVATCTCRRPIAHADAHAEDQWLVLARFAGAACAAPEQQRMRRRRSCGRQPRQIELLAIRATARA